MFLGRDGGSRRGSAGSRGSVRGPNAASEKRFVAAFRKSIAATRGVDEAHAVVTEVAAAEWDRKTRDFRNAGFGFRDSECRASLTLIVTWGLDG